MRRRTLLTACTLALGTLGCRQDLQSVAGPVLSLDKKESAPAPALPLAPPQDPTFIRGIYYFAGWSSYPSGMYLDIEVPHPDNAEWNYIESFNIANPARARGPVYGMANENSQGVADDHIVSMSDAGFNYVVYQVGWSHDRWKDSLAPAMYFDYAAKNHMTSFFRSRLKFSLSWHNVQSTIPSFWTNKRDNQGWTAETWRADFEAMERTWFEQFIIPSQDFYKIGERPVIFFWGPQDFLPAYSAFGANTSPTDMIALFKQVAASYGFSGTNAPYLVATAATDAVLSSLAGWGFDAVSGYVYYPNAQVTDYAEVMASYRYKWVEVFSGTSLTYFVPNVVGLDGGPTATIFNYGEPTAAQFEQHVRESMDFAAGHPTRTGRNIITCCWNEWGEGPYLQPSIRVGSMWWNAYHQTVVNP